MSKNRFVSAKEVVARLVRGLGYKLPSSYMDDVLEWIAEGLGMLRVTNTLVTESSGDLNCPGEILVDNHCAQLPCGFISMIAVEDENGLRLPEGSDQTDLKKQTSRRHSMTQLARSNSFEVNPFVHQTSDGLPTNEPGNIPPYYIDGSDIKQQDNSTYTNAYYKLVGNHIQTSFECGYIRIHYWAIPVDHSGYPMIPDNENLKQALEWHVIRRLIGSGYEHKVFTYQVAEEMCEKNFARAISEVSYPTPETMARINRATVRLIEPYNFYEDFFVGGEQPERLRK